MVQTMISSQSIQFNDPMPNHCIPTTYSSNRGGFLYSCSDGLYVWFGNLIWMKSRSEADQIINYFYSQGYAQAQSPPWYRDYELGAWVVTYCLDGYQPAFSLDDDDIPF